MSTEIWNNPNDPNPEDPTDYPIGYEGVEHAITKDTALAFAADIFRAIYPGLPIISALAVGLLDWNGDSVIPTYGSWAGPGWSGNVRSSVISWNTPPCYNENIKRNRLAHPSFPFSPAGVEVPLVMKKLFQLEAG